MLARCAFGDPRVVRCRVGTRRRRLRLRPLGRILYGRLRFRRRLLRGREMLLAISSTLLSRPESKLAIFRPQPNDILRFSTPSRHNAIPLILIRIPSKMIPSLLDPL